MKIFILAFCIFQISLAQVRIVAPPRPIGKFVAQKSVEPPKQAPNVYVSSSRYFKFLSDSLLIFKGTPGDQTVKNFEDTVAEVLTKNKVVTDGFQAAGISLEIFAAHENYNLYSDVMSDLIELANNKHSSVTRVVIPRISLPANLKVPKISQQTISKWNNDLRQLGLPLRTLYSFEGLFVRYVGDFPKFVNDFLESTLADQIIKPRSPALRLRDVAKAIVDSGTPVGVVISRIIQAGARSVMTSYGQLVFAAQL